MKECEREIGSRGTHNEENGPARERGIASNVRKIVRAKDFGRGSKAERGRMDEWEGGNMGVLE